MKNLPRHHKSNPSSAGPSRSRLGAPDRGFSDTRLNPFAKQSGGRKKEKRKSVPDPPEGRGRNRTQESFSKDLKAKTQQILAQFKNEIRKKLKCNKQKNHDACHHLQFDLFCSYQRTDVFVGQT